jgi:Asp-tRNA(Asn)/Glu-tRNA(Gln) amidotransferase A subunit family amidase
VPAAATFRSIRDLASNLRARRLSPVALVEEALERIERLGPRTNAVVTVLREQALREARAAEREINGGHYRSPLQGIPVGIKDLLATRGVPTTWGAAPYRNQVLDYDATVVERLRAAGAVLVAKLSMVELAGGLGYDHADAAFNGPGLNPWNPKFWSGGSSSGPASALADGLLPLAIGSETSGSILTPAAFCGVTGLRPTYGRVSRHGAMALCWTLDKLGPMAHSADDCGLALAEIAGADPRDPTVVEGRFEYSERTLPARRLRIAVPKGVTDKVQAAVRENFVRSLEVLRRYGDVSEGVEWPDFPWGPAVSAIVSAEGGAAFLDLIESGRVSELRCPADRTGGYPALLLPAVEYLQSMRLRRPMKRAVQALFERFEVIASPARASVAYPADKRFEEAYPGIGGGPALIPAGNLCGLPALCMPNGFGENGLPTGIALMGPAFSEATLLQLGNAYQSVTDWHARHPAES